jgi:two-component system response regulator PilR (NtrC family)
VTGEWDVLVVDDEEVVRNGVERILAGDGLRVALAATGREALEHPAAASCRLVLCDLVLHDIAGIDVLRSLRRGRPDLPVVVITGYVTAENASRALEAGAAGFLPKPFDERELREAVERATGGAKEEGLP